VVGISVVIAVHNDAQRVGAAVRSALQDTVTEVIVVDDGSTDGSADVAAAVEDPRVRVIRREARSGFPGVPRNEGLDQATGEWFVFVDSDDELAPTLAFLVAQGESAGADAVYGRVTRVNPARGTTTEWMAHLLSDPGVTSIAERPQLIGETTVGGKLLRRSAIGDARFPTDILYEDLVFAADVTRRLGTVVVTDSPIYTWYVRSADDDRSISNSRRELTNLGWRLEANRRAATLLGDREDLRVALDRKVVDHDLPLVLRDLADRPEGVRAAVVGLVRPFVASLHPTVRSSTAQPAALVLAALATEDVDEVMAAAALGYRRQLARQVRLVEDRWLWPVEEQDVTDLVAPLLKEGVVVLHTVEGLVVSGGSLQLTVRSVLQAGTADITALGLLVVDRRRKRRVARSHVVAVDTDLAAGLSWEATVPLGRGLRGVELLGELDVRVVTEVAGADVRWVLGVPEALVHDVVVTSSRFGRAREARAYQTELGNLSLRRVR